MKVTQTRDGRQSLGTPPPRITAGVTLKAVQALQDPDVQHFTREQVAYLIHLAFLSGAEHRRAHDLAELLASWDINTPPRRTRQDRIAWEMRQYIEQAEMRQARDEFGRDPRLRPVADPDWPAVATPGGTKAQVAA